MSIATTPTKLSIAEWAAIIGFHPLHIEGVTYTHENETPPSCEVAILQHAWQAHDTTSRDDVANAIATSEQLIEQQLGYHLIPSWDADEWHKPTSQRRPEAWYTPAYDLAGRGPVAKVEWKDFISGGIEAKTLIAPAATTITWAAKNARGIYVGSVTAIVPTGTQDCEVELYYPGHDGDAGYQIRPVQVSIVGTTATITFRRELVVSEDILESLSTEPADYDDAADFLSTVDVYRHWNDPSSQVTFMWEPGSWCGVCDGTTGCQQCSYMTKTGCLYLRSTPRQGMVSWTPGVWNAETSVFDLDGCGLVSPDLIRLNYYSGHRATTGCPRTMDRRWADIVAKMACAFLERPMCDCTADTWEYWREDLAVLSGGEQNKTYSFTLRDAAGNNPFGTRRGHLYAWAQITSYDVAAVRGIVFV